jgi:hypothetical protein
MTDRNNGNNTETRNPDGTFAQGNPGKPMGSRHRATKAVENYRRVLETVHFSHAFSKAMRSSAAARLRSNSSSLHDYICWSNSRLNYSNPCATSSLNRNYSG